MFAPDDGKGSDGLTHFEGETLTCLCGLTVATTGDLDRHFLGLFTPAGSIGADGKKHERIT